MPIATRFAPLRSASVAVVTCLLVLAVGRPAAAQASVPRAGTGSVTLVTQAIDNRGHVIDDGSLIRDGKSTTIGIEAAFDYGVTRRLAISASLPFVIATYRGPGPPPPFVPFLPVDSCFCYHSGWQDLAIAARYNVARGRRRGFALTPTVGVVVPTHAYAYVGEAVIGRRLREFRLGLDGSQRLLGGGRPVLVEASAAHAFVERVLDVPNNRTTGTLRVSLPATRAWVVGAVLLWQRTHGGLRFPQEVAPFPDRIAEHDRLLRDDNVRVGAEGSYVWRDWDLSGAYLGYTRGTNTHILRAYTVSVGHAFGRGRR